MAKIKESQKKRIREIKQKDKDYTKREKYNQKIYSIVTEAGWTNFERKGLDSFCKKLSRGSIRKYEFGKEFIMRIIQLHITPWIEIYTIRKDIKTVQYFGRCKKRKDLKHIERLLNIK